MVGQGRGEGLGVLIKDPARDNQCRLLKAEELYSKCEVPMPGMSLACMRKKKKTRVAAAG